MTFIPNDEKDNLILTKDGARLELDFASELQENLFPQVDELLLKARKASAVFTQYSQEMVDKIVYTVVRAAIAHSSEFAKLAVEETRMGLFEDKILKNIVASEFL